MGRHHHFPRRYWLPLLAISLIVCAHDARAQVCSPQPSPLTAAAESSSHPSQIQQPADLGNFAVADATVGNANPFACEPQQCDWPRWYVIAESLFLWRDNHFDRSVANDFGVGVGPKVVFGISPNAGWSLQAEYFGLFGMDANSRFVPPYDGIPDAPNFSSFNFGEQTSILYESQLNNAELNVFRTFNELSFLAGFRYLNLSEDYGWQLRRDNIDPQVFSGAYQTSVDNNLYGGQLGLRWRHNTRRFIFEATGKSGVFGNCAQANGFIQGVDSSSSQNVQTRFPTVNGSTTAFVGDLNFTTGFHLSQIWSVRAGYNLLWINGLAMAPDRVTFRYYTADSFPLYMERRVFLHGANVGLEATW